MARRLRNSLENAKDRRARFRRGFAFGFFAISYAYASLGWLVSVISQQITMTDIGPLGVIVITLDCGGDLRGCHRVYRTWGEFSGRKPVVRFMSALYSLMLAHFAGTILFLVPMITR